MVPEGFRKPSIRFQTSSNPYHWKGTGTVPVPYRTASAFHLSRGSVEGYRKGGTKGVPRKGTGTLPQLPHAEKMPSMEGYRKGSTVGYHVEEGSGF